MKVDRYDIRTSSRRVFRRCLRKWGFQSSMRSGLQRRGAETNINFWFGSAIHFAMEDYFGYNKFGDPKRAFKAYYDSFKPSDLPDGAEMHYHLGLSMLSYFLEWYPIHNQDMQFETIWFDADSNVVAPGTEGAHPGVEEEFLLDLGFKVIIDAMTGKIIKEWEPKKDNLYSTFEYNPTFSINNKMDAYNVEVGENSCSYYYRDQLVRIVPICYHGTMDRMVIDRFGRWWILDYKTAKSADTAKLDTDDQITSYMWAAEQRYGHKIHGFIYLQLTKAAVQVPKRLKTGALSVDKRQKTTRTAFKNELLKDYGSLNKAPNNMIEMLNYLAENETAEGDKFVRWDFVERNDAQKVAMYNNIIAETSMMINPKLPLYPNPTRDCVWDCPFRHICIAMDRGEDDIKSLIDQEFQVRDDTLEHNDDDWKDNIVFPTCLEEQEAWDHKGIETPPDMIIELPEKFLENDNFFDLR